MTNPYQSPTTSQTDAPHRAIPYVGFWPRLAAHIIDTMLFMAISLPVLFYIYGIELFDPASLVHGPAEFIINYVFPAIAVILFWVSKSATPGKMAIGARIVDARTLGKARASQMIIRYFGYFVSTIPLFMGLIWVAFDARKQGWHDKLAGTVVIHSSWQPAP